MEHVRHRWQSRIIVKSKTIFAYSMWLDSHRVCFCMRVNENQTLLTASKNEQNKMGDRFIFASSFVSFRFVSIHFLLFPRVVFFMLFMPKTYMNSYSLFLYVISIECIFLWLSLSFFTYFLFVADSMKMLSLMWRSVSTSTILTTQHCIFKVLLINWAKRHKLFIKIDANSTFHSAT